MNIYPKNHRIRKSLDYKYIYARNYSSLNSHGLGTSLRVQTVMCGVVTPYYGGANNKVLQLHAKSSELLNWVLYQIINSQNMYKLPSVAYCTDMSV